MFPWAWTRPPGSVQCRAPPARPPASVPHVGRVNPDRDREPLRIHRGVALPAPGPLARVVSRRAARLRRPHRPAAGRGRRRRRGAPRPLPRKVAQRVRHAFQNAVVAPRAEVVPNRRKGGKHLGIARHRRPVAGMYRIAPKTVRRSTVQRRPGLDEAGRSGPVTRHSLPVKSLSYRSGPRLYFSRVVPFRAMRPSLSGVGVGGETPHPREAIHILGQPLKLGPGQLPDPHWIVQGSGQIARQHVFSSSQPASIEGVSGCVATMSRVNFPP